MLVHTMLRAAYHTTHKHLQEHTTWWYEDEQVHMDSTMRSNDFWKNEVTCLNQKVLYKLLD